MAGPFTFGSASRRELETLDPSLRLVMNESILIFDFSIVEGRRTIREQIRNLRRGVSKTIDSRHVPRDTDGIYVPDGLSEAADIVPYQAGVNPWPQPSDPASVADKKIRRFYFMQGVVYAVAAEHDVALRFGLDWDGDLDFFDQRWDDLGHVELAVDRAPLRVPDGLQDEVAVALDQANLKGG